MVATLGFTRGTIFRQLEAEDRTSRETKGNDQLLSNNVPQIALYVTLIKYLKMFTAGAVYRCLLYLLMYSDCRVVVN